ncbi:MAG: DMT family transporter [Marinomonadaceae bacterium]
MSWLYLIVAGILECIWAIGLKQSDGFTKLWPSVISAVLIVISLGLLSLSMRTIPVSTAYTVWTGIGASSLVIVGMFFLGEPVVLARLACVAMIIAGTLGLQLLTVQTA